MRVGKKSVYIISATSRVHIIIERIIMSASQQCSQSQDIGGGGTGGGAGIRIGRKSAASLGGEWVVTLFIKNNTEINYYSVKERYANNSAMMGRVEYSKESKW